MNRTKRIAFFVLFFAFSSHKALMQKNNPGEDDIKIALLIIASDNELIYTQLQQVWKSYMHSDPEHVEAYFIRGDENVAQPYGIQNDTIWSPSAESIRPGILNKTISAMEALHPRINEFDYIVRTNLSTFYLFPRLLNFLKKCPKHRFYAGPETAPGSGIGSGSGFIISADLMELMLQHKHQFWNNSSSNDDNIIGHFLNSHSISLRTFDYASFYTMEEWHQHKDTIHDDVFQIRVKMVYDRDRSKEISIHAVLLEKFYGKRLLLF